MAEDKITTHCQNVGRLNITVDHALVANVKMRWQVSESQAQRELYPLTLE